MRVEIVHRSCTSELESSPVSAGSGHLEVGVTDRRHVVWVRALCQYVGQRMSGRGRGPVVLAKYVLEALKKRKEVSMIGCMNWFNVWFDRASRKTIEMLLSSCQRKI